MKIYRHINKIAAISFDLDDTLYDNVPIIKRAEHELVTWLAQQFPHQEQASQTHFWRAHKLHAIKQKPQLVNDVTQCRKEALSLGFKTLGIQNTTKQTALIEEAMHIFMHWRNQISVAKNIETLLADLAKKLPLIVITNGNADISQLPIAKYFFTIYAANTTHPMKPAPAMYQAACNKLRIQPTQLLHVGDSVSSDILGARHANCPSAWFNPSHQTRDARTLPDIEINDLEELRCFIS